MKIIQTLKLLLRGLGTLGLLTLKIAWMKISRLVTRRTFSTIVHSTLCTLCQVSSLISRAISGPYFSYSGSLTTPGCNEGVQWILFSTPLSISSRQVSMSLSCVNTFWNFILGCSFPDRVWWWWWTHREQFPASPAPEWQSCNVSRSIVEDYSSHSSRPLSFESFYASYWRVLLCS